MTEPRADSLIGTEIAHFKVVAKLGEGGMGAVYRARDTKLGRDVALKILPEELSADSERLARLRREAQVLASLNHPNIASIFGIEETDNHLVLVLELVEGEELAGRLKRGALAMDETIDLATQIASGLEEAHERGIIHRDLKPANLMITDEGVVKVLDFGLAKPYVEDSVSGDVSDLATVSGHDMTREGVIMGTASYMSPEQARGGKIDRRSDVWSYGCVLFEMVTGRRAFGGETMTDVLVSVVTGEPDWSLLPPYTPAGVRRLLRRCLQRDPKKRLRSLGDAVIELSEASEPEVDPGGQGAAAPSPGRGLVLWSIIGPLLGIVLGLALWWLLDIDEPVATRTVRQLATLSEPVAVYGSFAPSLAVSPRSGRLVYVGGDPKRLFGRPRDQLGSAPLSGTEDALAPFFSPDGRMIGYWADGWLKTIPTGGGNPVNLCSTNRYFYGATWGFDGQIYFSRPWTLEDGSTTVAVVRVPEAGGAIELVAAAEPVDGRRVVLAWPRTVPDGRHLLITRWGGEGSPPAIEVLSIEDGTRRLVVDGYQQAILGPDGTLVAATPDGRLVGLPFDLERLEVTGDPIAIANGVNRSRYGTQHFAVDRQGAVYWIPATGESRPDQLVWVDRDGRAEPASSHLRHYESPRLYPGGFVAVGVRSAYDDINIWFLDTVRDTLRPVTTGSGYSQAPVWLPGGTEIAYSVPLGNEELPAGLYLRSLDGRVAPKLVAAGPLRVPTSVSSDGSRLLFTAIGSTTGWDLWQVERASESAPDPLLAVPHDQINAAYAPEPGWIAFEADPSGRHEIYVRRLAEGGPEVQVSPHGGNWPVWNPQGNELFYLGDGSMMSVVVDLSVEPSAEPARPLFAVDGYARTFDVTPDGLRFLMIRLGEEPTGSQINLTLDWNGGEPK